MKKEEWQCLKGRIWNFVLIVSMLAVLAFISCVRDELPMKDSQKIGFGIDMEGVQEEQSQTTKAPIAEAIGGSLLDIIPLKGKTEEPLYLHTYIKDGIDSHVPDKRHADTRASQVTASSMYPSFGALTYVYSGTWSESLTPDFMYNVEVKAEDGWSTGYCWPGKGRIRFFAYAPYNGQGISLSAVTAPGTPSITYHVPASVSDQKDLLAAHPVEKAGNAKETVHLKFYHALTAVKFVTGEGLLPGDIDKITIKGVHSEGTHAMGSTQWTLTAETGDFSCTIPRLPDNGHHITGGAPAGQEILSPEATFMMLPQTLPEGAEIEILYTDTLSNTQHTLTAAIAGKTWPMGKTVTYKVSLNSIHVQGFLSATGSSTNPYLFGFDETNCNQTLTYKVTSGIRLIENGNVIGIYPCAWHAEFSEDNGNTWTREKPSWLTEFTSSATPESDPDLADGVTYNIRIDRGETNFDQALQAAAPVTGVYNLSNSTGAGSIENTANCYLVNAPGEYKLPLVYGNAITGGQINEKSYVSAVSNANVLPRFKTHEGADITSPYIEENSISVADACLVWQDAPGLISNIHLQGSGHEKYIHFSVDQATIAQGNAIIAARTSDGTVVWSWHIWVTPYKLGSSLIPYTQSRVVTIGGQEVPEMMPLALGTCEVGGRLKPERKLHVMFWQDKPPFLKFGGGSVRLDVQLESVIITHADKCNAPYYQWGRKDPMCPSRETGSNADKTLYYDNTAYQWRVQDAGRGSAYDAKAHYHLGIQYPWLFFIQKLPNNAGAIGRCWTKEPYCNLWNVDQANFIGNGDLYTYPVKSIYDPSPAGFAVMQSGVVDSYKSGNTPIGGKPGWEEVHRIFPFVGGYRNSLNNGALEEVESTRDYWTSDCTEKYRAKAMVFYGKNGGQEAKGPWKGSAHNVQSVKIKPNR